MAAPRTVLASLVVLLLGVALLDVVCAAPAAAPANPTTHKGGKLWPFPTLFPSKTSKKPGHNRSHTRQVSNQAPNIEATSQTEAHDATEGPAGGGMSSTSEAVEQTVLPVEVSKAPNVDADAEPTLFPGDAVPA